MTRRRVFETPPVKQPAKAVTVSALPDGLPRGGMRLVAERNPNLGSYIDPPTHAVGQQQLRTFCPK